MSLKSEFYDLISNKEKEIEEALKEKYINSNLYAVDLSKQKPISRDLKILGKRRER